MKDHYDFTKMKRVPIKVLKDKGVFNIRVNMDLTGEKDKNGKYPVMEYTMVLKDSPVQEKLITQ